MRLTKNLKLVEFPVNQETEMVAANILHIWLFDRSGSMSYDLPQLIELAKKQARTLKVGDALTFGYFSSYGQFGFPIKNFIIVNEGSYDQLDRLFDNHKRTLGLTCFSQSLEELLNIVKEAEFLNFNTSVLFFSDGYANDKSQSSEYAKVRELMPKIGEAVDNFVTVAHSNYSDTTFLAEMAELAGGESIMSSSMESFTRLMDKYLRASEKLTPRQTVSINTDEKILGLFSFGDDSLNLFQVKEDGVVQSSRNVYAIVEGTSDSSAKNFDAGYASALTLVRKGDVSTALEVLDDIGDKYFIDRLSSAFTPSERGMVEDELKEAIFDPKVRYRDGVVQNYLPDPNAFCVLDLANLLLEDSKSLFYPRHPEFKYNAIGVKSVQREGYEKFNAYLENSSPISSFVWNKEFLNLSVRATVKGTVKLKDKVKVVEASGMGEEIVRPNSLGDIKETYQHRNYTLIKDGFLNITKLPISASLQTLQKLQAEGLIQSTELVEGKVYVLDLTKIPVVNRNIMTGQLLAKDILQDVLQEKLLEASNKVLNALRKEIAPDAPKIDNGWTEEERKYLLASGFREDNSYSPPTDKGEVTDHYEAVSFNISIKGVSSFPSLADLRKRYETVKSYEGKGKQPEFTTPMLFELPTFEQFENIKSLSTDDQLTWIDSKLKANKLEMSIVRDKIQRPKFALVLGRKWFADLPEADAEQVLDFESNLLTGKSNFTGLIRIHRKTVDF